MGDSVDKSYNNSNIKYNETDINENVLFIVNVVTCIITSIGLPLTLVAIYGLYTLVRNGQVAPIYIINLLISDLIQFCIMISDVANPENYTTSSACILIYAYGLMVSICFMVCIALERYLVIAWPLWYRFRRNIKTSVVVCVVVWILPLLVVLPFNFVHGGTMHIILIVFFLLPLPLFIFSLCGTIKALSAAISVPPDEKRRIVAILVLVLLIYTVLFLPLVIMFLVEEAMYHDTFPYVADILAKLSPLADLFLYVFSRKGAADKFLAFVCRCRMSSDTDTSMNEISLTTASHCT